MLRLSLATFLFTTLAAAADADRGAALFRQKACYTCHAADGSGDTPTGKALRVRDLRSDDVQKQTDEQLSSVIADGKGNMPAFKAILDAEQIRHVVAHIRRLKQ